MFVVEGKTSGHDQLETEASVQLKLEMSDKPHAAQAPANKTQGGWGWSRRVVGMVRGGRIADGGA